MVFNIFPPSSSCRFFLYIWDISIVYSQYKREDIKFTILSSICFVRHGAVNDKHLFDEYRALSLSLSMYFANY